MLLRLYSIVFLMQICFSGLCVSVITAEVGIHNMKLTLKRLDRLPRQGTELPQGVIPAEAGITVIKLRIKHR